jgi:hypothetical protein
MLARILKLIVGDTVVGQPVVRFWLFDNNSRTKAARDKRKEVFDC